MEVSMMRARSGLTRRGLMRGAAATALAAQFPMPALAATRTLKLTLPWLAQGSSLYTYVARAKGFMTSRGIEIEIARGFGSVAAAQALAGGQFDFGIVAAPPLVLSVAKGLPLMSLATCDYDATMGVGVLADSPIKRPQDLAGRKMGAVPTSGEYPFFPAYAKKIGVDAKAVELVHMDNKVLERALMEKQVDAILGFASSSLPVLLSKDIPVRWMLYSSAGIRTYGQCIATVTKTLEQDPALCQAVVDGLLEAERFTLLNPEESMEIFFKEVPEMGLNPSAKAFARIGLGMWHYTIDRPDPNANGIGWADAKVFEEMTDLVMDYIATPEMKRPPLAALFTNRFVGEVKLSPSEWGQVRTRVAEFGKYIG
jgi:ABC-type nitrate/sulfonate/bicarbonate transport system substrate-binding protein